MVAFSLRPHTCTVSRNSGADDTPPTKDWSAIITDEPCNTQTNPSGNIGNEADVLNYDYVTFYDFKEDSSGVRIPDTEIKVGDRIVSSNFGKQITGYVKKWLPGQLSNRIWFNEISS